MPRDMSREGVEAHLVAALAERRDIAAVYLFGSVARDAARQDSDVDVGILFATVPQSTLDAGPRELEMELERRLGGRVQLVVLNAAPADLRIRVLRAGGLILDRDRSARIRFEVSTRNEFFDLEPILRSYRAPREPTS